MGFGLDEQKDTVKNAESRMTLINEGNQEPNSWATKVPKNTYSYPVLRLWLA